MPKFADIHSDLRVTVASDALPIEIGQLRKHVEYMATDRDAELIEAAKAAVEFIEHDTQLALLDQTLVLELDAWPSDAIELRKPPVTEVVSVKYLDTSGVQQTLDASKYYVNLNGEPGRIVPALNEAWPIAADLPGAIEVTFKAGATDKSKVPKRAVQAMKLLTAHWFANREAMLVGSISSEIGLTYNAAVTRLKWYSAIG